MGRLSRRFLLATSLLLGLQVLGASVALLGWRRVVGAVQDEQNLAGWRTEVTALGVAVREQYVHQAHSFIEGDGSHLDHYAPAAAESQRRLARLQGSGRLPVPDADARVASLTEHLRAFDAAFTEDAMPVLRRSSLDRASAVALHGRSEVRAAEVERDVRGLLADLEAGQQAAQRRASSVVARAWWATAALLLVGVGLVLTVTRRLAHAVLDPLHALRVATARFGDGDHDARVTLPVPLASDDEIGALAFSFNRMVERVAASEERRVRTERLAALGEMSAAVAHELLNPLTVILGSTSEPTVRAEAEHAQRVVQGLLGFARPGEETPRPLDVALAARQAVERLGPLADAAGVQLAATGPALERVLSPSALRQVLDNLVRNGIEASPAGATVDVITDARAVRVLDRGFGIPEAVRARLYEPFVTGRAAGTGLGLAVAARIARAQGGELRHEDRAGGGTVAILSFGESDG